MNESGKVALATALSVAMHVSLFAILALMPGASAVPVPEPPPAEPPLEVTLEAAPPPEPSMPSEPIAAVQPPSQPGAIQTQIDPENLKKAERPPEHPVAIAAHDSQASPGKAAPTPDDPSALTLASAAEPEGEIGIDALGNYGKAVGNAIGARWEFYRQKETLDVGEVRLKFTLDAQGRISGVQILSNTAKPANAAVAVRAVQEARIPPIPPERLSQLPGGRTEIVYSFTSY
ncbi:MAG: TonB family protein [Verrucomicrobiota bacterium]